MLNKVKNREQELETLFRDHYEPIYRAAYNECGNTMQAEDVAQNVFVKLVQGELKPENMRNPRTYLCRVAMHETWRLYRSHQLEDLTDDFDHLDRMAPEDGPSAEEQFLSRLEGAAATLKPRAYDMLRLRYQQDLGPAEIAKMMDTSEATVSVTLNRLRARLKEHMETSGGPA